MKKLRRIRITTFRRRTTAIVLDWERGLGVTPFPGFADAAPPARSDLTLNGESDLQIKRHKIKVERAIGAPPKVDDQTSENGIIKHSGG